MGRLGIFVSMVDEQMILDLRCPKCSQWLFNEELAGDIVKKNLDYVCELCGSLFPIVEWMQFKKYPHW